MPGEEPVIADSGTIARVRDALAGGKRALGRDRDLAAWLEARYPGSGSLINAMRTFHRRAARWAVEGSAVAPPAFSVIFTASGLPVPGRPLHADAAAAAPSARFCYADNDPKITAVSRAVLAEPGRVTVMTAAAGRPAVLLAAPQARELTALGPVSVQVLGAAHYWPPDVAAEAIAGYGSLLPPGSSLCISWALPDGTPAGAGIADAMHLAGVSMYCHQPADMERWTGDAGMRLHPQGITGALAFGAPYSERREPGLPSRMMEAVAVVPRRLPHSGECGTRRGIL